MVTSLFNTDIQCQLETACQLLAFGRMYACCLDVMQAYIRAHAVSYAKPQVEHEGGKANLARQKSWRWPTLRLSPPSSIFASSPPTYMHAAFWFLGHAVGLVAITLNMGRIVRLNFAGQHVCYRHSKRCLV